jgi:hypothetical protein
MARILPARALDGIRNWSARIANGVNECTSDRIVNTFGLPHAVRCGRQHKGWIPGRARDDNDFGYALKKPFNLSAQDSSVGECLAPPFFSDSSSSFSSLRWCSVSFTGVSTAMWQYRSPG